MEEKEFSRNELYELVWSKPVNAISESYKISTSQIHKACLEMEIPLPDMGYWTKIKFGKEVKKKPLTEEFEGVLKYSFVEKNDELTNDLSPLNALIKEIESNPKLIHQVPEKITKPHPLIVAYKQSFNNNEYWHFSEERLSIHVGKSNLQRAIRIMDTFLKLIIARGHVIGFKYGVACVKIGEEEATISLRNKDVRVEKENYKYEWDKWELKPTDILVFKIECNYEKREWMDGKILIEERLSRILAYIELKAEEHRKWMEYSRVHSEIREKKELIEREIQLRKDQELINFQLLLKNANRWQQSCVLRDYVSEFKNQALSKGLNKGQEEWIEWAQRKINWYDPLIESNDKILTDDDRNSLQIN